MMAKLLTGESMMRFKKQSVYWEAILVAMVLSGCQSEETPPQVTTPLPAKAVSFKDVQVEWEFDEELSYTTPSGFDGGTTQMSIKNTNQRAKEMGLSATGTIHGSANITDVGEFTASVKGGSAFKIEFKGKCTKNTNDKWAITNVQKLENSIWSDMKNEDGSLDFKTSDSGKLVIVYDASTVRFVFSRK